MFVKIRKYKLKENYFDQHKKHDLFFRDCLLLFKKKKTISLNKLNKENYEIFSNTSKVAIKYRKIR